MHGVGAHRGFDVDRQSAAYERLRALGLPVSDRSEVVDDLAAEHISGMRWWRHGDIAGYGGTDLFSPRDVATPLAALIAGDIPGTPVMLGL